MIFGRVESICKENQPQGEGPDQAFGHEEAGHLHIRHQKSEKRGQKGLFFTTGKILCEEINGKERGADENGII